MDKTFREQTNIGRARYAVSFHDGVKTHGDGSPFFDLRIFRSKREKDKLIRRLRNDGYREA